MELGNAVRRVERTGRGEQGRTACTGDRRDRRGLSRARSERERADSAAGGEGGGRAPQSYRRVHGAERGVSIPSTPLGSSTPAVPPPSRVLGAYSSGSRAHAAGASAGSPGSRVAPRVARRVQGGPAVLPACAPARRQSSTIGGPCVPTRTPRLGRRRPGGARRLAGEVRAGLADRVLAAVAVGLGSATVVVVLGLLADLAAAR